jgi:hypothetical protein
MALIERVQAILLKPKQTWPVIAEEGGDTASIFTNYVMILAAIPAVCAFIGLSLIGVGGFGVSYRMPILTGVVQMIVSYLLSLAMVFVLGADRQRPRADLRRHQGFAARPEAGGLRLHGDLDQRHLQPTAGDRHPRRAPGAVLDLPDLHRHRRDDALPAREGRRVHRGRHRLRHRRRHRDRRRRRAGGPSRGAGLAGIATGAAPAPPAGQRHDQGPRRHQRDDQPGAMNEMAKRMEEASKRMESAQKSGDPAATARRWAR